MAGTWIFAISALLCAAAFTGIGIYAGKKKTPMHFWSGTEVPVWQIRDVPAYNRENRNMWLLYAVPYWLAVPLGFLTLSAAGVLMVLACTAGLGWLIWRYRRIEQKYRR